MTRKSTKPQQPKPYDALIIGGGMVGTVAACLLAKNGLRVAVIDRADPKAVLDKNFDGRTIALSYGSIKILDMAGIWPKLSAKAEPIFHIHITDGYSPFRMDFHHDAVGPDAMGQIVLNQDLRAALFAAVKKNRNIDYCAPINIISTIHDAGGVSVATDDGKKYRAPLILAADGRKSSLRKNSGVDAFHHDYAHTAIIATMAHDKPHHNTAFECFHAMGPLALLPMPAIDGHPYCSSLVWSESPEAANELMRWPEDDFCDLLYEKFGPHLGELRIIRPRQAYPLNLIFAKKLYAPRMAFIGDAAHGIHPIAGQGLNLGLRDVEVIAPLIARQKKLGLDLGSDLLLRDYDRQRAFDTQSMIVATHGLNWLFAQKNPAIRLLRGVGMNIADRWPAFKNAAMRRAMGKFAA